jgi:hypothetical protein
MKSFSTLLIRRYKDELARALHMVELHAIPQGDPDYRFICQKCGARFRKRIRR